MTLANDPAKMTDEALVSFDKATLHRMLTVRDIASSEIASWSAVLKELDRRGKVKLVSGSFDEPGDALIHRWYD